MWRPAEIAPLPDPLLSTNSERHGVGCDMRIIGALTGISSTAWNTANRAVYMPVYLDRPVVVLKLWVFNGATASGNIDVGLYDRNYNRLTSAGSTAQAGTNVLQEFDVADLSIAGGVYFIGIAASATTTTFFMNVSNVSGYFRGMGITQQDTALPLPNPAVPAALGTGMVSMPVAGLAFRTLVA